MQIFGGEDVSQPNISDITPTLSLSITQSVPLLLDAIALGELALAHLINSEAENIQIILGTVVGAISLSPAVLSVTELLEVDKSVRTTLQGAIKKEMLLEFDFENVINLIQTVTPVTPPQCPLTFGKSKGFWSSNNGHAILDPDNDGDIDPGPVTLGMTGSTLYRGVTVSLISDSDAILLNKYCTLTGSNCTNLSDDLQSSQLEALMAQALGLTYNIGYIPCYSGQTVSSLGCASFLVPIPGLPPDATVNQVLAKANSLIANSQSNSPNPTSKDEATSMTALLNCLNTEDT